MGQYGVGGTIYRMHVVEDLVLLSVLDVGIVLVDVSDPSNPSLVGSIDAVNPKDATASNGLVYVCDWDEELLVYEMAEEGRVGDDEDTGGSDAVPSFPLFAAGLGLSLAYVYRRGRIDVHS
jgi:hypothetical protein